MCKPSTLGTGAAEPCGRGGSSPAWCKPNGICSRSCAPSSSIRYAPASPTQYRWSSVHTYLGLAENQLITSHDVCLHLGCDVAERVSVYAKWLHAGLAREDEPAFRPHLMQERALGSRHEWNVHWAGQRRAGGGASRRGDSG